MSKYDTRNDARKRSILKSEMDAHKYTDSIPDWKTVSDVILVFIYRHGLIQLKSTTARTVVPCRLSSWAVLNLVPALIPSRCCFHHCLQVSTWFVSYKRNPWHLQSRWQNTLWQVQQTNWLSWTRLGIIVIIYQYHMQKNFESCCTWPMWKYTS